MHTMITCTKTLSEDYRLSIQQLIGPPNIMVEWIKVVDMPHHDFLRQPKKQLCVITHMYFLKKRGASSSSISIISS